MTALLASGILRGQDLPPSSRLEFDWRELRRWGIDEVRLPEGSVVLFREKTLWSEHGRAILAALALLVARRQRIGAQARLHEAEQRYPACVGMSATSCRPGTLPNMARCTGCRISPDRRTVTLMLAATPGPPLMDDVRRSGLIAAVFSQPSTHYTLQLKGTDARIVPLEPDIPRSCGVTSMPSSPSSQRSANPEPLARAFLASLPDDLAAVQFTISAAFSQTPGPQAGAPLAAVR